MIPETAYSGPVLLVDTDPAHRRTLERQLQREGISVISVTTGLEAVELALQSVFALILIDLELDGDIDGPRSIQLIRGSGVSGQVIAMTGPPTLGHAYTADDESLVKPVDAAVLTAMLSATTGTAASPLAPDRPLHDDAELQAIQQRFLQQLDPSYLEPLRRGLAAADVETVTAALHKLKGTAGSFGYDHLGSLAATVERRLHEGQPLTEARHQIDNLFAEAQRLLEDAYD